MPISDADYIKYPFLPNARRYLSRLDLKLNDLATLPKIRELAKQRVLSSINLERPPNELKKDIENEIIAYTLAILYVSGIGEKKLTKIFAKYEGDKINQYLKNEKHEGVILEIARAFKWNPKKNEDGSISINFTKYLENASKGRLLHNNEWKLINRLLENGMVRLPPHTVARLLQEEVHEKIEESIIQDVNDIPKELQDDVNELRIIYKKNEKRFEKVIITVKAKESEYPPCISSLIKRATNGKHLSHVERFTLVTYLLHQDVEIDEIVNLFSKVSDFKEDFTRYQIENLAGKKGSIIKPYITYNCSTLQTHNVCLNQSDPICASIKNPLSYHLIKKNIKPKKRRKT